MDSPRLSIFLSHHESDTQLAQTIRDRLHTLSDDAISVETFVQMDQPTGDFRDWVNEKALQSDIFLFLFTDDSRELTWAAHELGMYAAARVSKKQKPIPLCLKSRGINNMPPVMSHIAPKLATTENIKSLFNELLYGTYTEGDILADKKLLKNETIDKESEKAAADISCLFKSKTYTKFFADRLIISDIPNTPRKEYASVLKPKYQTVCTRINEDGQSEEYVLDLAKARISANGMAREYMHLGEDTHWSDLVTLSENEDPCVRFSIPSEITDIASQKGVCPKDRMTLADIQIGATILRPIIPRVETRDKLPIAFYILLIPDKQSSDTEIEKHKHQAGAFAREAILADLLTGARRFLWYIVEPHISKIKTAALVGDDLAPVLEELMSDIVSIEKESEQSNLKYVNYVAPALPDKHRRDIERMYQQYFAERRKLDHYVENQDVINVLRTLEMYQRLNREFLPIVLDAYREVMLKLQLLSEADPGWEEAVQNGLDCRSR